MPLSVRCDSNWTLPKMQGRLIYTGEKTKETDYSRTQENTQAPTYARVLLQIFELFGFSCWGHFCCCTDNAWVTGSDSTALIFQTKAGSVHQCQCCKETKPSNEYDGFILDGMSKRKLVCFCCQGYGFSFKGMRKYM